MAQYLIIYTGGNQPTSPDEGRKHFIQYQAWLRDLGDAVVSAMNPIRDTHTISPDGTIKPGSQLAMSGYTIIQANSIDEALELAKTSPFLAIGGSLEVSERVILPS